MNSLKLRTLYLLIALAAFPAFAASADLVSVSTTVSHPTAPQGGANEGTVLINNHSNIDVRVRLDLRVIYADGTVQRLSGISDPGVLRPGDGFFLSVYFIIPDNAALGTATFVADVTASGSGLQEQETSRSTFQVVAP